MTAIQPLREDFEVPAHARGGQVTLNLYDHLAAYAPKRPGAYLRISSDRFGLEAGVDRLVRQPRDLQDLIDIVEYIKRPVTGATGGRMNLINDSDRHLARLMCVMALKSSEDTARRVARQHLSAAQNGIAQGRIAYGWVRKAEHKGQLIPNEDDLVVRINGS